MIFTYHCSQYVYVNTHMIILYVPTHRHIQLCVWNHWHETNLCLTASGLQRCPPPSSQCPLGRVCFRRLRFFPLSKEDGIKFYAPESEPNKRKSCWYQGRLYFDSSVFFWPSQSIWIWWSDWWMLDLLLNLYFHYEFTINALGFWKYL